MATVQINSIEYDLGFVIIKKNEDGGGKAAGIELSYDDIANFQIDSDLSRITLTCSMLYYDRQNIIATHFYADSSTVLQVQLATEYTKVKAKTMMAFVIDAIQVISKDTGVACYQISGTHIDFQKLEAQVNYSTYNMMNGKPQDALEIVKNLLAAKNIENSTDKAITESGKTINYISFVNDELRTQIDKLMNIASAGGIGIYFLGYDILKSTFIISSAVNVPTDGARVLMIANATSGSTFDNYAAVKSMEEINTGYIASSAHKFYDDREISTYSHIDRKWSKKIYKFDDISKILQSKEMASEILYSPPNWQKTSPLAKDQIQDVDDSTFGFALRSEMLLARCIKITTGGNLQYRTGEMIFLGSHDDSMLLKYGGMWLVTMINHKFTRSIFDTELTLTKVLRNKKDLAKQ